MKGCSAGPPGHTCSLNCLPTEVVAEVLFNVHSMADFQSSCDASPLFWRGFKWKEKEVFLRGASNSLGPGGLNMALALFRIHKLEEQETEAAGTCEPEGPKDSTIDSDGEKSGGPSSSGSIVKALESYANGSLASESPAPEPLAPMTSEEQPAIIHLLRRTDLVAHEYLGRHADRKSSSKSCAAVVRHFCWSRYLKSQAGVRQARKTIQRHYLRYQLFRRAKAKLGAHAVQSVKQENAILDIVLFFAICPLSYRRPPTLRE
ncbi:hypothetical protein VTK56DRAFT_6752 [Thermocarpiscus australiensis]